MKTLEDIADAGFDFEVLHFKPYKKDGWTYSVEFGHGIGYEGGIERLFGKGDGHSLAEALENAIEDYVAHM